MGLPFVLIQDWAFNMKIYHLFIIIIPFSDFRELRGSLLICEFKGLDTYFWADFHRQTHWCVTRGSLGFILMGFVADDQNQLKAPEVQTTLHRPEKGYHSQEGKVPLQHLRPLVKRWDRGPLWLYPMSTRPYALCKLRGLAPPLFREHWTSCVHTETDSVLLRNMWP